MNSETQDIKKSKYFVELPSQDKEAEDYDPDCGRIDYKNVALMKKFITIGGRVLSRRATGLTSRNQRKVRECIKQLRFLGLLPYCDRHKK